MNNSIPSEVRLALRRLCARPSLSAAVVLPIALAIALTSALFSILDGLLFRPLPFVRPIELVAIDYRRAGNTLPEVAWVRELAPQREQLRRTLEDSPLLAGSADAGMTARLEPGASDSGIQTWGIDSRVFRLLGLRPMIGNDFTEEDERSSTATSAPSLPVPVLISHAFWQRAFGGDPNVVGVRELAGRHVRVVGVMGPGVKFPGETDVWVAQRRLGQRPPTYARLAAGATVAQLDAMFPLYRFTPLEETLRPGSAQSVPFLFGAACLLLLVAWVQVAALVFAGTIGRVREIGVRMALGGSRVRIARELAVENALLAGIAFVLAWICAPPLTSFIVSTLPRELTRGQYLLPDIRTFAFGCLATVAGLGLLSVLPVRVVRRTSPLRLLQGHIGELPFRAERLRHGLLGVQVTLTTVLLYLSGLMVHSFVRATGHDYGFDAKNVVLFTPPLPPVPPNADLTKYRSSQPEFEARWEERERKVEESLDQLRGVSGVIAAAAFLRLPLITVGPAGYSIEPGTPGPAWAEIRSIGDRPLIPGVRAQANTVTADFVRALGATLVAGRSFDGPESTDVQDVVVVSEALARQLSPSIRVNGENTYHALVGRTIGITDERRRAHIIGVIKDLVYSTPGEPTAPQFYVQPWRRKMAGIVAIRTSSSVEAALPAIRSVLQRVWGSSLPPRSIMPLRDGWHGSLVPFRAKALLLGVVAASCVPLAAIGLLGALLYSVQVRTRETALRIALGAEPSAVRRAVVLQSVTIVAAGILLGTAVGAGAGRAISHQLFNVYPADPWTMAAVASGLLAVAWLAALVPAGRASRTEPAIALRHD